jgi:hypothetical protein
MKKTLTVLVLLLTLTACVGASATPVAPPPPEPEPEHEPVGGIIEPLNIPPLLMYLFFPFYAFYKAARGIIRRIDH